MNKWLFYTYIYKSSPRLKCNIVISNKPDIKDIARLSTCCKLAVIKMRYPKKWDKYATRLCQDCWNRQPFPGWKLRKENENRPLINDDMWQIL